MNNDIKVEPLSDHEWANNLLQTTDLYERTKTDKTPSKNECVLDQRSVVFKATQNEKEIGFFLVVPIYPHTYEIHSYLLPDYRGKTAILAGNVGCDYMFLKTDCAILTSVCPEWIPESRVFAKACGFETEFHRNKWAKRDGEWKSATIVTRNVHDWVRQRHKIFQIVGERFHRQLENLLTEKPHEDDVNHDSMVGMLIAMGCSGQLNKGLSLYNQWGSYAGYIPVRVISQIGGFVTMDIESSIIQLDHEGNIISARRKN